ncbi:IclR family transcriptional regulator [Streptomyces sp. NPDC006356]
MTEIAQTADHALRILEELGRGEPLSPNQLCERLDLNRTVVQRLLKTLDARGFVLRQGTLYAPGATLVRLAGTVGPSLRAAAVPVMRALCAKVNESIVLHVVDGLDGVVLEQVVATDHIIQVSHPAGSRHPLVSGASGRAILAFQPEAVRKRALARQEQPALLERNLEAVRQLRYAVSVDELQDGVHGVAVPLLDADGTAVGSLAVLAPTSRARGIEGHVEALWEASEAIRLAYQPFLQGGE